MAISYPITLPGTSPAEMEWGALNAGGASVSPYTLAQETYEWPGNRWRVSVRYAKLLRAEADAIAAALASLYGVGTMLLGPYGAGKTAKGAATGAPLVNGAGQTGKSLVTDGWTPNVNGILKTGDYFEIASRLYLNLKDVNSDAGGNATLDIWPRLRETPADNAALVVANPKGTFRLANFEPKWTIDAAYVYGLNFEAEEAF